MQGAEEGALELRWPFASSIPPDGHFSKAHRFLASLKLNQNKKEH
jgi:hypothetical protein